MALVLTHSHSYPLMLFHSLRRITRVLWLSLAHRYSTRLSGFTAFSFQTKMGDNHLATTVSVHAHTHTHTHTQLSSLRTHIPTDPHARSHSTPHFVLTNALFSTSSTWQSHSSLVSYSASNKHPMLLERDRASVRYTIYLLLVLDHTRIMTARALEGCCNNRDQVNNYRLGIIHTHTMPCPCHAAIIHTCHAVPLPFSDSAMSSCKSAW
jgi:hypothetical protein